MANLKEIRSRITSIGSTMQITNAMKMVSVAKLKKAQDSIVALRPYAEQLAEVLRKVNQLLVQEGGDGSTFTQKREIHKVLHVVVSSNRGLCGGFNSAVVKEFHKHKNQSRQVSVLTIGKKAFDLLKKEYAIHQNCSHLYDALSFDRVAPVVEQIIHAYLKGEFDLVLISYNKFINPALQEAVTEQILPVKLEQGTQDRVDDYIFEPSKQEILSTLLPKAIKVQVYKAILDSVASEHGARMTAMHKATDNAKSLSNDLVIYYNKARQAAITNEILEIVSGAEALK